MTATEQQLACLHADALLLQQRLQLATGLQEAAAKVSSKRDQLLASTLKRDRQADIYGPRTQKAKRMDEAAVEAAGKLPSSNEVRGGGAATWVDFSSHLCWTTAMHESACACKL